MNNHERLVRWEPLDSVPEKMYLQALRDDDEGFRLILTGGQKSHKTLRINFDLPLSYRNIDEGNYLKTLNTWGYDNWVFYKVENSGFSEWFAHQSLGVYEKSEITHYSILTPDDCVDVLSKFEPTAEWLNE